MNVCSLRVAAFTCYEVSFDSTVRAMLFHKDVA